MSTEDDPTAIDPDELPAKPPITDPRPSDEELEAEDAPGEEELDVEPMSPEEAAEDDTVDDAEHDDEAGTS